MFVSRVYNRFEHNKIKNTVTKFSKETRLRGESNYYVSLPESLKIFYPRLIERGFSENTKEYYMEIEFYPYQNMSNILFFKENSSIFPSNVMELAENSSKLINQIFDEFSSYKPFITSTEDLHKIYIEKTENEQKNLIDNFEYFSNFSNFETIKVNQKEYENFHIIWPKIKEKYTSLLFDKAHWSIIHGDMCFSNILFNDSHNIIRLIDPRGEFGQHKIYGDLYYDLAKLHHSTNTGYEYIINDKFVVSNTEDSIDFIFNKEYEIKNLVHKTFYENLYKNYDYDKIRLIEATIYIGMCARHGDSLDRQKIMYSSGIKLLNEIYHGNI